MHRNAKRDRRGLPLLWRFRDGGSAAGRWSWLLRRHDVGIGVVLRGRFSSEELQNSVECLAEDIHKDAPCWPLCYQQSSATSLLRYCGQPSAPPPSKNAPIIKTVRRCARGMSLSFSKPPLEGRFQSIVMIAIAHPGDTSVGAKQHRCPVLYLNTTDTRYPSFRDS